VRRAAAGDGGPAMCLGARRDLGQVDDIQFDVYQPGEIRALCGSVGLKPLVEMVRWNPDARPSADSPRYQLVSTRPV